MNLTPQQAALDRHALLRDESKHKTQRIAQPPCRFLGALTGETAPCATCKGEHQESLHGCAALGQCTITRQVTDKTIACCAGCATYQPRELTKA